MNNKILRAWANAKVNLALHVVEELPSGLHALDSLVAFPAFGDELIFTEAKNLSLKVTGPFSSELLKDNEGASNLVIKAAKLFEGSNRGASIELVKNLPTASGIGGGSSDAAITIQTLARLWNKKIPPVAEILKLGADVPVCLSNGFQRMQGVGDDTRLLPRPAKMWIVLANPGVKVSTKKIFDLLKNKNNEKLESLDNLPDQDSFFSYLNRQRNDLEEVTCRLFPEVKEMLGVLHDTPKCQVSRMSGSGATCFGLYARKEFATQAVAHIKKKFPSIWVVSATLFSSNSSDNEVS